MDPGRGFERWAAGAAIAALAATACNGGAAGTSATDTTGASSTTTTGTSATGEPPTTGLTSTGTSTSTSTSGPGTTSSATTGAPTTSTGDTSTSTGTTTGTSDTTGTAGTTTGGAQAQEFVTYLGGAVFEHGRDLAYDGAGNLYVAGGTGSDDFPHTLGAGTGTVDVFVAKYDPTGALLWARRLGGPGYDRAYAIEVDGAGVVVAGRAGDQFPTTAGALQTQFGGDMDPANAYGTQDGFVARISESGAIEWATYFGGPGRDFIRDVAVDVDGDIYVAASQVTRNHPHVTPGVFDGARAGMDCVAAKLAADGAGVVWAGYLGGSGDDCPEPSIAVDAGKAPTMVIATPAADLPDTPGAFQPALAGDYDLFVAKIAPHGGALVFGTYFGGSAGEGLETHNLAVGPDGRVYLGAVTLSSDLPITPGALQPTYAGSGGNGSGQNTNYPGDGFVAVLSPDGMSLHHCTYLGGNVGDAVEGVAVAPDGRVFVSGGTFSSNFPTTAGAYQSGTAGNLEAFLAVLAPDLGALEYASFVGGSSWDVLRAVALGPDLQLAGAGETRSNNLNVTPNAADASFGGGNDFDAVVAQLLPDLP